MFGLYPKSYETILKIIEDCVTIDQVVIYGSRAKGTCKEGSDVDITLFGDVSNEDLFKLRNDLDDSDVPYLFDISIHSKLSSESLKEYIARVGKVFYKREILKS